MTSNRNPIKQWFITFPKSTCSRNDFLDFLRCNPLSYFLVAEEAHQDGTPHLHACIQMKKGISKSRYLKEFKVQYPQDNKRIQLQVVRSMADVINYCKKEDYDLLESPGGFKSKKLIIKPQFPPEYERKHKKAYRIRPDLQLPQYFADLYYWTFDFEKHCNEKFMSIARISRSHRTLEQQHDYDIFDELYNLIVVRRDFYSRWM